MLVPLHLVCLLLEMLRFRYYRYPGDGRKTACAMIVLTDFGRCRLIASMVAIVSEAWIPSLCQCRNSCAATSTLGLTTLPLSVARLMLVPSEVLSELS
jgi:hypothetical protein